LEDTVIKNMNHSIDLYTGDFTSSYESSLELSLHEIIYGLSVLSVGGSFICKIYFTPLTINILSIMSEMFTNFALTKPLVSQPEYSELYIVGKGFKGYGECISSIIKLLPYYIYKDSYCCVDQIPVDFYLNALFAFYLAHTHQIKQVIVQVDIAEKMDIRNVKEIADVKDVRMGNEYRTRNEVVQFWKKSFPIPLLRKEDNL
jgi:hypothetical protein